jgi:hypothetical protein
MRTRPASITTIAIALGLALTTLGIARVLPYTFAGVGDRSTVAADVWAHGTAVSPSLVALVVIGILAAVAVRPTPGGRRSARWLAVLAGVLVVTGLLEPAQRELILFGRFDPTLTPLVWGLHGSLIALVLSAVGESRRGDAQPSVRGTGLTSLAAGGAPAVA